MNNDKSFKIKHTLELIAFVLIVCVFCPAFSVSCYGQSLDMSAMDILVGIKYSYGGYEEQLVEGQPIMLITIVLPVAILLVLSMDKRSCSSRTKGAITLGLAVIDFIVWIVFKGEVKSNAQNYGLTYETLPFYYINMAALILFLIDDAFVVIGKLGMEDPLVGPTGGNSKAVTQISNKLDNLVSTVSNIKITTAQKEAPESLNGNPKIGFCQFCGNALYQGDYFCVKCGARVSEDLLNAKEDTQPAIPQMATPENLNETAGTPVEPAPISSVETEPEPVENVVPQAPVAEEAVGTPVIAPEVLEAEENAPVSLAEEPVKEQVVEETPEEEVQNEAKEEAAWKTMENTLDEKESEEKTVKEQEIVEEKPLEEQEAVEVKPQVEEAEPVVTEAAEFKFCPYCGSKLVDGAMFCTNCGKKVK